MLLRRHLQILIRVTQRRDEQTRLRLPQHHRHTAVAAFEQGIPRIERKSRLQLVRFRAVALVAALDEHRADVLLEEGQIGIREASALVGSGLG